VSAGFETTVFDNTSVTELIDTTLDDSDLNDGITYYWRARHYDDDGAASDWSASRSFTIIGCGNSHAQPVNPLVPVVWPATVDPLANPVQVGACPDITVRPSLRVPAADVGKMATLILYIYVPENGSWIDTPERQATLTTVTEFDLIPTELDLSAVGGYSFHIYYGYMIGSDITFSAYALTVGDACDGFSPIDGSNSHAWPVNPLVPVVMPTAVNPEANPVTVGACPDITIRPTLQVPAADVGQTATMIMYIYVPAAGFGINIPPRQTTLTAVTEFDLIPTELDLGAVGGYSFHIYYGYMIGSDITYSAYALTVGDACGN
jgi:hypothetical protein